MQHWMRCVCYSRVPVQPLWGRTTNLPPLYWFCAPRKVWHDLMNLLSCLALSQSPLIHTAGNFASFFIPELGLNSESILLRERSVHRKMMQNHPWHV
jgi:hypothetical protein